MPEEGVRVARRTGKRLPGLEPVTGLQRLSEILVLLLAAGIGSFLLFVPPVVGVADQGDFQRVMEGAGVAYPAGLSAPERHLCFLQTRYQIVPLHVPSFVSSEFIFVSIARIARRLAGRALVFDIRMVGLVHLLALLAGCGKTPKTLLKHVTPEMF